MKKLKTEKEKKTKKTKKSKNQKKTKKKKKGKNTKIYFIIYQFKNECIYRPGHRDTNDDRDTGNINDDRDTGTQLQQGRRRAKGDI